MREVRCEMNLYPPSPRRVNPPVLEHATCNDATKTGLDLGVQESRLVKWVMRDTRLSNVIRGQASVFDRTTGELLGAVLRTDEGSWWSMVPYGDAFDILEDHTRRRDAVARVVSVHRSREVTE